MPGTAPAPVRLRYALSFFGLVAGFPTLAKFYGVGGEAAFEVRRLAAELDRRWT